MPLTTLTLNDGNDDRFFKFVSGDRVSSTYKCTNPPANRELTLNVRQVVNTVNRAASGKPVRRAQVQLIEKSIPSTNDTDVPAEEVQLNLSYVLPENPTTITATERSDMVAMLSDLLLAGSQATRIDLELGVV